MSSRETYGESECVNVLTDDGGCEELNISNSHPDKTHAVEVQVSCDKPDVCHFHKSQGEENKGKKPGKQFDDPPPKTVTLYC